MALSTIQVTGNIAPADDATFANATVEFTLTGFETDDTNDVTVVPSTVSADIDGSGDIDVDLFPTDGGDRTRLYNVVVVKRNADQTNRYSLGQMDLPSTGGPYDLNDILRVDPNLPANLSIQEKLDLKADQTSLDATNAAVASLAVDRAIDTDAQAWIDATGEDIDPEKTSLINSTVTRLKIAGVWNDLDVINIDFGISEAAALRNLKSSTNLHTNNGATYSAGNGFTGDGSAAWIDSGLDPSGMAGYTELGAHLGVWVTDDVGSSDRDIGFSSGATSYITSKTASGNLSARINDASGLSQIVSTGAGFSGVNRSGASSRQIYKNGERVDEDTEASSTVPTGNFAVLRGAGNYSSRTVWAYTAGASLTVAQWQSLYTILNDARNGVALSMIGLISAYAARTKAQPVTIVSGVATINMNNGHGAEIDLTENITTLTIENWPLGISQLRFMFTQDATGGRTVTWPAGWVTGPGTAPAPTTTANYVTEIVATSWDAGTTVRVSQGDTWDG